MPELSSSYARWRRSILLAIGFWLIRLARPTSWSDGSWAEDWNSEEDAVYDHV